MISFLYIQSSCLSRLWTFSWTSTSVSPKARREKGVFQQTLSRMSSDAGASSHVFQTPLAFLWAEKGWGGRTCGQGIRSTLIPPLPISTLLGLMRKQDSLGKRTCISFFQGFVQYTYWTGKNCLWKLFRGGANRKYSCFPLNGFWGPLGQCSPLAVDTSKWFAFVSRGRIWIWAGVTDLRKKEKGVAEDVMLGWHYRLNGHGSEQPLGEGEG